MSNKKVYLSNGLEAELLAEYRDGNNKKYVVKVFCGNERDGEKEYPIFENRIVPIVYERCEDIPGYLEKVKLEKEISELKKQKEVLLKQNEELKKQLNSIYKPKYKIGDKVYIIKEKYISEQKIIKIKAIETENGITYSYICDKYDYFEYNDGFHFPTMDEAEKMRLEYIEKDKKNREESIKQRYEKAKKEYEELIKGMEEK